MTLRKGHGNGAGVPRIETLPPDELPAGVAAPVAAPGVTLPFRPDGKIDGSETARELGRRGGAAKAAKIRLIDSLGLARFAEPNDFQPYRDAAEEFVKCEMESLASQAGGEVGPGPATMVASAALQLAAARFASDRGARDNDLSLFKMASQLSNDSRQNLMAAYEMAVREAQTRPKGTALDLLEGEITGPKTK